MRASARRRSARGEKRGTEDVRLCVFLLQVASRRGERESASERRFRRMAEGHSRNLTGRVGTDVCVCVCGGRCQGRKGVAEREEREREKRIRGMWERGCNEEGKCEMKWNGRGGEDKDRDRFRHLIEASDGGFKNLTSLDL